MPRKTRRSGRHSRLTRLRHWLGLDCNPLRRRSDVAESVVRLVGAILLVVSGLLALPLSLSISTQLGPSPNSGQHVRAVVEEPYQGPVLGPAGASAPGRVRAHWQAPDGRTLTGKIWASPPVEKGDEVTIEVMHSGQPMQPLAPHLGWSTHAPAVWVVTVGIAALWAIALTAMRLVLAPIRQRYWARRWAVYSANLPRHPQS